MRQNQLVVELNNCLKTNSYESAIAFVKDIRPIDIADALAQINPTIAWRPLERLPNRATVFSYLGADHQVQFANQFPRASFAKLVGEMPADERTDLFKHFDQGQRNALLPALAQAEREDIRKLSAYVEGTAGALMTSDYATLEKHMTVSEALDSLRSEAPDAETIYNAYVIDSKRKLLGVISLRSLILANPDNPIDELIVQKPVYCKVTDKQEKVAKKIARYDLIALPILDDKKAIVGIVTHDDALDVERKEATEDFHLAAGVESTLGNLKEASIALLYRKRVFWLMLLIFGNLFSGAGIAHFEDIIAANIVLVFFLPLLVDSGGNAGSQSATLMVRALATGEVVMRDWIGLLGRETLVALCLGITMAMAVSVLGYIRGDEVIALILALSMVAIVLIGAVVGMSLPFVLNRMGFDPASASAPLITSICDASGVVIYLFIASRFLALG